MTTSHLENSDEITFGAEKQLASHAGEAREDNKKRAVHCIDSFIISNQYVSENGVNSLPYLNSTGSRNCDER